MIRDQPSTSKVRAALDYIDPDISYSDWLRIGMALHSWDESDGFNLWDTWSQKGSKYEQGDTENRWNNFVSGGGITIKTLFSMAMENGYDPTEEKKEEEIKVSNQYDPTELPCIALRNRFISAEVCKIYDVHTSISELDGKTLDKSYFPYKKNGVITGWHVRNHQPVSKKDRIKPDIGVGSGKLDFFGQDVAKSNNGKKLFITEGRIDCLSLYETITECTPEKWKHIKPSVVSVNNGAGSALNDCLNNRDFIERFDEVIIVFDPDEDGEKAIKKVLKSFPKFKVAKLPNGFDVNDMRGEDRDKELHDIVMWKSEVVRQGQVVTIDECFIKRAVEKPKFGLESPWPSFNKVMFGIRPGIYIVGAAPKVGKTAHKNQLVSHIAFNLNRPVSVFDLEVMPEETSKRIVSSYVGCDFMRPDTKYEDKTLVKALYDLRDTGIKIYDDKGSKEWEDILIAVEEQHLIDGINEFFIDPLTAFVAEKSASEANDVLNAFMSKAASLYRKYEVTIFMYSHLNPKPKGKTPHERGGRPYQSEFTGSRAMEKWAHFALGLGRDITDECPPEDQDFTNHYKLFSRFPVAKGYLERLYYDHETTRYLEI